MLSSEPAGLQLRYLQTLAEIAGDHNSTTIFPLPLDLIKPFYDLASREVEGGEPPPQPPPLRPIGQ